MLAAQYPPPPVPPPDAKPSAQLDGAAHKLRYGEFLSAVRVRQHLLSFNRVSGEVLRHERTAVLRLVDLHRLLTPYVGTRFFEQLRAVVPLALFLALFQVAALRSTLTEADAMAFGILSVVLGLMLFMEGVKYGLMPFSENIGFKLPDRSPTAIVLAFAFLLGGIATLAEPAIGALRAAGEGIDPVRAPWLYLMLTRYSTRLVLAVGAGVGAAVVLGMLRFIFALRMKTMVIAVLLPCLAASVYAGLDPRTAPILGLAWDCGAITTGPVTVPLVLALGIGVAAAAGQRDNPLSGFGIVTLASLLPALAVILVGSHLVSAIPEPNALMALAPPSAGPLPWWKRTPLPEIAGSIRAIAPLIALLWVALRFILGEKLRHRQLITYGVVVAVLGMALFNIGLTVGLIPLGQQAGSMVPSAFNAANGTKSLYPYPFGVALTLLFATAIGYGATIAEPALGAMGVTVENLTDGAFPRKLLIQSVAAGVALGTALGVAKIIFQWPMLPLLLGAYAVALICTVLSLDQYVSLAWDSAGVTTGPVTVPLVLALGLGLSKAVGAAEGFGILAMASAGPIVTVLSVGLWIQHRSAVAQRTGRRDETTR